MSGDLRVIVPHLILGAVPMIPAASSSAISAASSSEFAEHLVVVLAEQRSGAAVEPGRAAGQAHRDGALPGGRPDRVLGHLEEAAGPQLAAARPGDAAAAPWPPAPRPATAIRRSRRPSASRTRPRGARRWRRAGPPARRRGQAGSAAHAGWPSASVSASHCSSVATAMATQRRRPSRRCRPCGRGSAAPRAGPGCRPAPAARRRPSTRSTCSAVMLTRGVDHGRLDHHALAGAAPVLQGEQQAGQGVDAGVGIAQAVRLERPLVGMAGHPGETRGVLDGVGEGRVVAPGPSRPKPGIRTRMMSSRSARALEGQADLVEDPGV